MDRTRFDLLLPEEAIKDHRILVVGCGGIGSYTVKLLGRMGFSNFALVDPDEVEESNIATQDFGAKDISKPKALALNGHLLFNSTIEKVKSWPFQEKFRAKHLEDYRPTIVCALTDNIESRREVWAEVEKEDSGVQLYVDCRTGALALDCFAVDLKYPDFMEKYGAVLRETSYAPEPCGARAIAFSGAFAGATVASLVRSWCVGELGMGKNIVGLFTGAPKMEEIQL